MGMKTSGGQNLWGPKPLCPLLRILESPGTRTHAREARPQGGWRLSVLGEATPPRLQGVARLRPASPCDRERDGVSGRGVATSEVWWQGSAGALWAPGILAIRPLGWRLLPPGIGDVTALWLASAIDTGDRTRDHETDIRHVSYTVKDHGDIRISTDMNKTRPRLQLGCKWALAYTTIRNLI